MKKSLRRALQRQQKQVEDIGSVADKHLEKHVIKRLSRLVAIRRFLFGWLTLVALLLFALFLQVNALKEEYQTLQPVEGGIFIEGAVGSYSNVSPLYATSTVDSAVSRLIFAGLFQYDGENKLSPQLAENIEISEDEKVYIVTLKPDLRWHDGQPLTSQDVVFTYGLIQNPDVGSYLRSGWQGIKVEAKDDRTVVFTLPNILGSFPHFLTNGIVPKHKLESVNPEQMRSNEFNTLHPVGAGPFKFEAVEVETAEKEDEKQDRVGLVPFDDYVNGKPKLNRFIIRTFATSEAMEKAYADKEITAMSGLSAVPESVDEDEDLDEYSLPVAGQVMVFFKNTQPPLDDKEIRKALTLAIDRRQVLSSVSYPLLPSDSPLLRGHIGYNSKITQQTGMAGEARKILSKAGWKTDASDGLRKKGKKTLSFRLYAEANSEYASVTQSLQKQWREVGVDAQIILQSAEELQSTVSTHNYDALLYAISTGADPDVYAYWHSSQGDIRSESRLNFSEYRSVFADNALEAGRSRSDPQIRGAKYEPFLRAWTGDNPALALYQPRYLYIVREPFAGLDLEAVVTPAGKYAHVENWTVKEGKR